MLECSKLQLLPAGSTGIDACTLLLEKVQSTKDWQECHVLPSSSATADPCGCIGDMALVRCAVGCSDSTCTGWCLQWHNDTEVQRRNDKEEGQKRIYEVTCRSHTAAQHSTTLAQHLSYRSSAPGATQTTAGRHHATAVVSACTPAAPQAVTCFLLPACSLAGLQPYKLWLTVLEPGIVNFKVEVSKVGACKDCCNQWRDEVLQSTSTAWPGAPGSISMPVEVGVLGLKGLHAHRQQAHTKVC